MPATKAQLWHALDTDPRTAHLTYCTSSETLGLGQCQCNSHGVFGRRDDEPATPEDIAAFWGVVRAVDDAHPND